MLGMESLHQPAHPDPHEGACILESVANLPDYRDGGLIGAPVREILGEGRQRGFDSGLPAVLDVRTDPSVLGFANYMGVEARRKLVEMHKR